MRRAIRAAAVDVVAVAAADATAEKTSYDKTLRETFSRRARFFD